MAGTLATVLILEATSRMVEQNDRNLGPLWLSIRRSNPGCHTFWFLKSIQGKEELAMGEKGKELYLKSLTWVFCFIKPNVILTDKTWPGPCTVLLLCTSVNPPTSTSKQASSLSLLFHEETETLRDEVTGIWSRQSVSRASATFCCLLYRDLMEGVEVYRHCKSLDSQSLFIHLLIHLFSQQAFMESQLIGFIRLGAMKTTKMVVCPPEVPPLGGSFAVLPRGR